MNLFKKTKIDFSPKEKALMYLEANLILLVERLEEIPAEIQKIEEIRDLLKKENGN